MALFDNIVGQKLALALLTQALATGPSHAYLFAGPRGSGKTDTAVEFAAALACDAGGCGECSACRRAREGIHPDVNLLSPEGSASYLVDQIREINEHVSWRPYEAKARVWILTDAEALYGNQGEPANAFLRTLEEPPAHAFFVLVSSAPDRLLDTIASRCQRVPFMRVPVDEMTVHLEHSFELAPGMAGTLARISQGDLDYARELAAHPSSVEHRRRLISWARSVPSGSPLDSMVMLDDILAQVDSRAEAVAGEVESRRTQDLEWAPDARARARIDKAFDQKAKREKRRALNVGLDEVMDVFASWYRDLAVVALDAGDAVLNSDHLEDLQRDALPGMVEAYLAAVAVVQRAQERFRYNVDARCALEDMVFAMKEALS